jgi:hypothetical protein
MRIAISCGDNTFRGWIGAAYLGGAKVWLHNFVDVRFAVMALLASLIPDYVALGKTRLLLGVPRRVPGVVQVVLVLFADMAGSCIISLLCMVVIALGYNLYTSVALNDWLTRLPASCPDFECRTLFGCG